MGKRTVPSYLAYWTIGYRQRIALKIYPELRLWIREAEGAAYNRGYHAHETIRQIQAAFDNYKAENDPKLLHPATVTKKTRKTKTNK